MKAYLTLRRTRYFDRGFYLATNLDVAEAGVDPLMHFIEHGWRAGRDPSPDFSIRRYLEARPDVQSAGVNPLLHYVLDLEARPDVQSAGINRLLHYVRQLEARPAVRRAGIDRLLHHVLHGSDERQSTRSSPVLGKESLSRVVASSEPGDTILVWSGGNSTLPAIKDRRARLFPRRTGDGHGGAERIGDTAMIAQLEALRAEDAAFLLIPPGNRSASKQPRGFDRHVHGRYAKVYEDTVAGTLFALRGDESRSRPWIVEFEDMLVEYRSRYGGDPSIMDAGSGLDLDLDFPSETIFSPPPARERLPYLDESVDMVVAGSAGIASGEEVRRIARWAVVRVDQSGSDVAFAADWLREPHLPKPSVSIVIPTYNAARYVESCLRALDETLPRGYDVEIIVVDDASSDETADVVSRWAARGGRVRGVRNEANAGFIGSCNAGAEEARGDLLVFLNNDTLPLSGWLPPLVRTLVEQPGAGAVGGKLLYPDGRLQEAGGVIFSDGSGANFGKSTGDPEAPLQNFFREVDYCSGALLATRRELFLDLGGFDGRFQPMYYEDTDYCFQVRDAGLKVYYQPESAIVHYEGGSAGTDISTGMKRYQAVNRETFVRKWATALERQPPRPGRFDPATWYELAFSPSTATTTRPD
ncbi:MAG: glycosyltransferase family 2 protein [Actinomycetota bacterium]|nr:glycosyltransferase family 2 protein [Actinomycetota bacterium]